MSAPRSFEHEYLRQLIREYPDATINELTRLVEEHERETRGDPAYEVKVGTVAAVRSRNQDAWAKDGLAIPKRKRGIKTQPFANIVGAQDMLIRHIRVLIRLARGDPTIERRAVIGAENFADQLEASKQVVDLMPAGRNAGKPYLRPARTDELDGEGNIFTYTARYPGLSEKEWRSMSPAEREIASRRYRDVKFEEGAAEAAE